MSINPNNLHYGIFLIGTTGCSFEVAHAYIDEVERELKCSSRICRGAVRVALIYDDKTEGFVGGMD